MGSTKLVLLTKLFTFFLGFFGFFGFFGVFGMVRAGEDEYVFLLI